MSFPFTQGMNVSINKTNYRDKLLQFGVRLLALNLLRGSDYNNDEFLFPDKDTKAYKKLLNNAILISY